MIIILDVYRVGEIIKIPFNYRSDYRLETGILLKNKDSRINPKITMNYLSTDEDKKIALKAIKITRNIILNSKAFKPYYPKELRPGINLNDNEILSEVGKYANTVFHPVGTCRMGIDNNAVVDNRLKLKGIQNLRIIDASIMPHITSGNTNAPTIMIAEKGADMVIKDSNYN